MTQPVIPPLETRTISNDELIGDLGSISNTQAGHQALIAEFERAQAMQAAAAQAPPPMSATEAMERRLETNQFRPSGPSATSRMEQKLDAIGSGSSGATTAITQFGRGVVDAILAPGALVGATSELAGSALGSQWLKDFGRDLGEASSGQAYFETIADVLDTDSPMAPGTSRDTAAARAVKTIRQQEADFPLLSMISRAAGQAAVAAVTGAAAAAPKVATLAGVGAIEGAAAGAQKGYEARAPLVDVLSSTLLGSALGAAGGYGAGKLSEFVRGVRLPDAEGVVKNIGSSAAKAASTVDEVGGLQTKRVVDTILGAKKSIAQAIRRAGPYPAEREVAETAARGEVSQKIAEKLTSEVSSWASKEPSAVEKFFRRPEYLSAISDDLSRDFAKVAELRPTVEFDFSKKVARSLLEDADAPLAIGKIESRISELARGLPDSPELVDLAVKLRKSGRALTRVGVGVDDAVEQGARSFGGKRAYADGAAAAMEHGHSVIRELNRLAGSQDEAVRTFAQTARGQLVEDMSSEAFGEAGKLYRNAHVDSDALESLADPAMLRERLRGLKLQGEVFDQVEKRSAAWQAAYAARAKLAGTKAPEGTERALRELSKRVVAAERAITIDGKTPSGIFDLVTGGRGASGMIADKMTGLAVGSLIGGVPGGAIGFAVTNAVGPYVARALQPYVKQGIQFAGTQALPAVAKAAGRATTTGAAGAVATSAPAPRKQLSLPDRQEQYRKRIEELRDFSPEMSSAMTTEALVYMHEIGEEVSVEVADAMNKRVEQLVTDIPRPKPHIGGPAYEVLSIQDLKRSEAMWDATFQPMGMFDEFERGVVNYERISYTWKQYPGLQQAVQAGITDVINAQLTDDQRARIPSNVLTQWDYLGGFHGELQALNSPEFSGAVTETFAEQEKKDKARRPNPPPATKSPIADHQRSWSERIAR